MKVKLDENMPSRLADVLRAGGHDAVAVIEEGLRGKKDDALWQVVQAEGRLLITMDLDFADIRQYPPGSHAGVLILRLARQGRVAICKAIERLLAEQGLATLAGAVSVADEQRLRIRRP